MSTPLLNPVPLVIYHANCRDGFTAAWIADRALGGCDLHPANYGEAPPEVIGREVFILDFSYPRDVLIAMHERAASLIVLDHHKTAQEALSGLDFARFDMAESGASMAWRHFHPEDNQRLPALVAYVKDRDLWRHQLPHSQEINAWIWSHDFGLDQWDRLDDAFDTEAETMAVVQSGAAILRSNARVVAEHVARAIGPVVIEGIHFRVCNATTLYSEIAGALAQTTGAGACWFVRGDGRVQWSLRHAEVHPGSGAPDVSKVAKAFGGGGHAGASGFDVSMAEHLALFLPRYMAVTPKYGDDPSLRPSPHFHRHDPPTLAPGYDGNPDDFEAVNNGIAPADPRAHARYERIHDIRAPRSFGADGWKCHAGWHMDGSVWLSITGPEILIAENMLTGKRYQRLRAMIDITGDGLIAQKHEDSGMFVLVDGQPFPVKIEEIIR